MPRLRQHRGPRRRWCQGWPGHAPVDRIIVAAATAAPRMLVRQLALGGRMVLPIGPKLPSWQRLTVIDKRGNARLQRRNLLPARFVPSRPAPMIAFDAAG